MNQIRQLAEHPRTRQLAPWLPAALIGFVGLWLLWPVPSGKMPMSADHTVHLTRIWLWAQELASGSLRGWSPVWFFGAPIGELYPVAGDLLIIMVRVLSLGLLDWSACYALGFSLVFLVQGGALYLAARRLGLGRVAGTVAALLLLTDAGQYREGGWIYTVQYGVWPQALGTALVWWAMAELFAAMRSEQNGSSAALGRAGLLMGAAILAHPMTLPVAVLGGVVLVGVLIARDRARHREILARAGLAAVLSLAVAAWWLVPMLQHRAWMASYGWLFTSLERMVDQLLSGHLAQHVPAGVTFVAIAGLGAALFDRAGGLRFVAGTSLSLWFLASSDAFWSFRLDRLSEGFTHLQYQRFLLAAKPGFFLLAGGVVGLLARSARAGGRNRRVLAAAGAVVASTWMLVTQIRVMSETSVGQPEVRRFEDPTRATAYAELDAWMDRAWEEREGFFRVAVRAPRNLHWFMDAPVGSGVPLYKMGFTPGDNFVHKPESRRPEVLRALGVRYLVSERRGRPRGNEVARFGTFVVDEQPFSGYEAAWLRGPGTVTVDELDLEAGIIRGSVSGSSPASVLVFGVSGFPRWMLTMDGENVEWTETPVWGDEADATVADRRAGRLRGGKAHGDDGTEPTLIAAPARDGNFELRYRGTTMLDILGLLASLCGLAACVTLALGRARARAVLDRTERALRRALHPAVLAALVVAGAGLVTARYVRALDREASRAVGWMADGRVEGSGVFVGPIKTAMLIRPAVRARRGTATAIFPGLRGQTVGWIALDDDATKVRARGTWTLTIETRIADGDWAPSSSRKLVHEPGVVPLRIPDPGGPHDVRITVTSDGRPPALGFDLELEAAP